mmetsp:Transcript_1509/g.2161  ORF Transcript_1509/g.2161 Transcript_1509/m.2161 type:complete len:80 (-) Transcript_1509:86-325(-)
MNVIGAVLFSTATGGGGQDLEIGHHESAQETNVVVWTGIAEKWTVRLGPALWMALAQEDHAAGSRTARVGRVSLVETGQ